MRPDLFGTVVRPPAPLGAAKPYLLSCSIVIHVLVAAGVIAAPVLAPAVLPVSPAMIVYRSAAPLPPPPPAPMKRQSPAPAALSEAARAVPLDAPSGFRRETGLVEPDAARDGGIDGGVPDGIVGGGLGLPPEPPPPPTVRPPAPLRPGSDLLPPARIRYVQPAYPTLAREARVQGVVIIEAVIGTDGKVRDARVLRSVPLLDQAALDAVLQWEYTPTRLNGAPVAIVMTVSVHFTLR